MLHPHLDENGQKIYIQLPTTASSIDRRLERPNAIQTFVPGSPTQTQLNGIAFKKWDPPAEGWRNVSGQNSSIDEKALIQRELVSGRKLRRGPIKLSDGTKLENGVVIEEPEGHPQTAKIKVLKAGVVIAEPDKRVWIVEPTNHFGGDRTLINSWVQGRHEDGETLQETAIRETHEETGLKVKIDGFIGAYGNVFDDTPAAERKPGKNNVFYFLAKRETGSPSNMGWEAQALRLIPINLAKLFVHQPRDRAILEDVKKMLDRRG